MKFTLVFATQEKIDLSYGLLFVPGPAWYRGNQLIVALEQTPAPGEARRVGYSPGGLARLLEREQILRFLLDPLRACTVVIHPTGKGTLKDFQVLLKDLRDEGFTPVVVGYNGIEPYDLSVSF